MNMNEETFHTYFSVCSEQAYEQHGGLDDALILRHIYTLGVEHKDGIRGRDGKVYKYALAVLSRDEIGAELPTLIPEVTDGWLHTEDARKPLKERGEL